MKRTAALLFVLLFLLPLEITRAANFNVSTPTELIAAINDANATTAADTITLMNNIVLTTAGHSDPIDGDIGLPLITSEITIVGGGFTLSRQADAPIFGLMRVMGSADLTLINITLSGGNGSTMGGAIWSETGGTISITNSTLSGNEASFGGGIANIGSTLFISDSIFSDNFAQVSGGGIWSDPTSTVTITGSTFSDNTTDLNGDSGGGIFSRASTLTITDSIFSGNSSVMGGGIYNQGTLSITNSIISDNFSDVSGGGIWSDWITTITDSTISGNITLEGGGIWYGNSSLTVTDSIISDNTALRAGGMYNAGTVTIINSTISNNTADGENGGAIWSDGDSTLSITNSILSGNSAVNGGAIFSGTWIDSTNTITITNSILSGNSAEQNGGAIFNDNELTMNNSTLSGNSAVSGGAIWSDSDSTISITNSILWGNGGDQISATGTTAISYSGMQGGFIGTGNINLSASDPVFVAPQAAVNAPTSLGDYHLRGNSPVINMGDNTSLPADTHDLDGDNNTTEPLPVDLDFLTRVQGAAVDMGAYEALVMFVNPTAVSVIEGGATDSYLITSSSSPLDTITITMTFDPAQITVNGDTDGSVNVILNSSNWNTGQTVTVAAVDDDVAEGTQIVNITHTVASSDPKYDGLLAAGVGVTISDNDLQINELVINGGFESAGTSEALPANWNVKRWQKDRRVCNTTAFEGECAYRFRLDVTDTFGQRQIKQRVDVTLLDPGMELTLSAMVRGTGFDGRGFAMAKVIYTDGSPNKRRLVVNQGSYDWTMLAKTLTLSEQPVKVMVIGRVVNATGSLFIDNMSLTYGVMLPR